MVIEVPDKPLKLISEKSIKAVQRAYDSNKLIGVLSQRNSDTKIGILTGESSQTYLHPIFVGLIEITSC